MSTPMTPVLSSLSAEQRAVDPTHKCEIESRHDYDEKVPSIGRYQVFDGETPTMSRPAWMCAKCVAFAIACGMTPREAVEAPVTFPEADQRYPLGMYRYFERDQKAAMRTWVAQAMAEFWDLYPPVRSAALDDHRDALVVAEQLAAEEIRRPLNTNEIRLLGEAVRDILTAKLVLRDTMDQERELEREIL